VRGGGVFFYGSNADPRSNYFLRLTLVGGSAVVALGGDAGTAVAAPAPATARPTPLGSLHERARLPGAGVQGADGAGDVAPPPAAAPAAESRLEVAAASARRTLPRPWRGWLWVVVAGLLVGAAAFAARDRFGAWWRATADRYVRG
jgi:hypothetical protein